MAKASDHVAMTETGHCAFPSSGSHQRCHELQLKCSCECHSDKEVREALDASYVEPPRKYTIQSLE